jgi:hypothetical protein
MSLGYYQKSQSLMFQNFMKAGWKRKYQMAVWRIFVPGFLAAQDF